MKKKVKIIAAIVVVIGLVAYGVVSALTPMPIETKTIETGESEISFIESGVVVNSGEKVIYPMVAGQVSKILVEEGDMVKKGDVLASLDQSAVEYQMLQLEKTIESLEAQSSLAELNHQNQIDALKASRSNLQGQLQSLKAQTGTTGSRELEALLVEQSKEIYDRGLEDLVKYEELFAQGIITEMELKDYKSLVDTYEANYNQSLILKDAGADSYEGNRNAIIAQISSINATLERDTLAVTQAYNKATLEGTKASLEALKVQASYYNIIATVDGVVNEVTIENVNMVTGMEPAFTLQGAGENKIEVKVNTRDIEVVEVGDTVELILDRRTGDIKVEGMITHISSSATVEISPLGVEERKVQVIVMPKDQEPFGAGYDVDVKFIVFKENDKIIVPNSALYEIDEEDYVMVIDNGVATERLVTLGFELTGETIVDEGLNVGDQIITDLDAKGLKVGSRVSSSNE